VHRPLDGLATQTLALVNVGGLFLFMASSLTTSQLQIICPMLPLHRAESLVEALNPAAERFKINQSDDRYAAWLAQCAHESQAFTRVRENLYYTTVARVREVFARASTYSSTFIKGYLRKPEAFANWIYAGRLGNGSEKSGDGWRYRGGGIIGLTGRENYRQTGYAIGFDLLQFPELIERDDVSALAAGKFWASRGCNELVDKYEGAREATELRLRINGGYNGLADAIEFARLADRAFGLN
jgi:putative chitinase